MPDFTSKQVSALLPQILLVEDDDNDIFLMRRALTAAQVKNPLLVAHNGAQAIDLLKKISNKPALLITDIKMPKLDGFELLLWLQTQPYFHDIPKLVISSSIIEEDLAKSLLLGATAYFIKPNRHHDLIQLVSQWKKTHLEPALRT
jgi:CheY-like chemotaxis protein